MTSCALPCDVAPDVALAVLLEGPGEQHDAISGLFQNLARREIMLLRENLGRSHERDLVAVFDSNNGRLKGHDRLPRSDIALQQTPHGIRRLHVGRDFLEHSLLRSRRMKRQYLLNGLPDAIVELKGDSRLRLLFPALEFKPKLDEEQLIEDQPDVRGRARRLQIPEALTCLRRMHLPKRSEE